MTDEIRLLKNKLKREIEARKQAEFLLEEKTEELYDTVYDVSTNEALLKAALSNMQEGFLLTDENANILLVNQQLKDIYTKYAPYMHVNINLKQFFDIFIEHPTYQKMMKEDLSQCSYEIKLNHSQVIAIHVNRSEKGIIVSTHRDVSQEKLIISEQQQAILKLLKAEKMEHIGKMASSVAHDFNNIITAIKGYASFLKEDMPEEALLHDSVDKIQEASARAQEMVNNILAFSKHAKPKFDRINIINLLNETVTLIRPNIPENVSLSLDLEDHNYEISGNASQLSQVFINFINNTINATGQNPCRISIDYQLLDQIDLNQPNFYILQFFPKDAAFKIGGLHAFNNKCIKINFYDDGPGMDKNILDHIFEMFFTTKNSNKGTGLGMYSVATTITDHNGGIKIHSKPRYGTYIEIVFPILDSNFMLQINTEDESMAQNTSDDQSQILIIDDNQEVGHFIQQTLLRNDIESVYKDTPELGLCEILRNPNRWKLIICDQKMPNILGLEILKSIRSESIETPFILTSGYIEECKKSPDVSMVDQLLPKPIDVTLLMDTINKFMN